MREAARAGTLSEQVRSQAPGGITEGGEHIAGTINKHFEGGAVEEGARADVPREAVGGGNQKAGERVRACIEHAERETGRVAAGCIDNQDA